MPRLLWPGLDNWLPGRPLRHDEAHIRSVALSPCLYRAARLRSLDICRAAPMPRCLPAAMSTPSRCTTILRHDTPYAAQTHFMLRHDAPQAQMQLFANAVLDCVQWTSPAMLLIGRASAMPTHPFLPACCFFSHPHYTGCDYNAAPPPTHHPSPPAVTALLSAPPPLPQAASRLSSPTTPSRLGTALSATRSMAMGCENHSQQPTMASAPSGPPPPPPSSRTHTHTHTHMHTHI